MAITVAQPSTGATSASTTALATSFAAPTTAGNGIVACVGSVSRGASSVTDDAGNTYVKQEETNFFGSSYASIWLCANATAANTVTANFASGTNSFVVAAEVNGQLTLDTGSTNTANGANAQPGAITTAGAQRVLFNAVMTSGSASAVPSGDTELYRTGGFGGSYQVYTSVQTGLNPQWTSTIGGYACVVAAFSSTNTGATGTRAAPPRPFRSLLPFGPWAFGLPIVPSPYFVPAPAPPHAAVPPVMAGLPLYPLPIRLALFKQLPSAPPPYRAAPPPPPPVPPPGPGRGKRAPFVRRQTSFDDDARRLRRTLDQYSVMFNSLIAQGVMRETSLGVWQVVGGAHSDRRDPAAADDVTQGFVPGSMWLNTNTQTGFMCVSNAQNGAQWKQVT